MRIIIAAATLGLAQEVVRQLAERHPSHEYEAVVATSEKDIRELGTNSFLVKTAPILMEYSSVPAVPPQLRRRYGKRTHAGSKYF